MKLQNTQASPSILTGKPFAEAHVLFRGLSDEATFLRKMVDKYGSDLALKEASLKIIRDAGAASRDEYAQAIAIGQWVQDNIFYVHETEETFQTPFTTLRLKAGDCDDFTTLIAAMLSTLGIGNKLALMQINGRWAHIFPIAIVPVGGPTKHRVPLDATLPAAQYRVTDVPSPVKIAQDRGDEVRLYLV